MKTTCDTTSTREKETCGCMDVGTIIDNTDCSAAYSKSFASRDEATAMQASLVKKARDIESEPCQIDASVVEENGAFTLKMRFVFACQAETVIFQLGIR